MSIIAFIVFIITIIVLLAGSAFFSGSETALLSLTPVQVQQIARHDEAAGKRLRYLLDNPDLMLSTILIGNTLVNTAIASIGLTFLSRLGIIPEDYLQLSAIFIITSCVLLFGEISPKQFAVTHAVVVAPIISRVVHWMIPFCLPFSWLLKVILSPLNKRLHMKRDAVTDHELLSVIELGEESGTLDGEECEMVTGVMRLSQLNASDVMTPRVDMVGLDLNDDNTIWEQQARELPFRFLPVWDDTPDHIIGLLNVAAYLIDPNHDRQKWLITSQIFQPENIGLDDLLIFFYEKNQHTACLVDEYGGIAGIVTRGDVLEVLAADMPDSDEQPEIRELSENSWKIDGSASLEQINFDLGTHLEADDSDRLAGWVHFHAKRIPVTGEIVEADGYRAVVAKMRQRKILSVILTDLDPDSRKQEVNVDETGLYLDESDRVEEV